MIQELQQFGYDLFGVPHQDTRRVLERAADETPSIPSGAVQDGFVISFGDEIEVVLSGQRTEREIYKINNQGLLLIEDFPPIPAAGRTMGQLRISIEAAAHNLHNTKAHISLSSVRQIGVIVIGHVNKPGRQNLTVFHTVLDALMGAQGINKTGSLRQIKLVRNGRSTLIDLYSLLMHGAANIDLQLRDGDRLIIPPIGPTMAVAGEVNRSGIFELLPSYNGMRHSVERPAEKLSLNDVLEFAGGILSPGKNRLIHFSTSQSGKDQATDIKDPFKLVFGNGSILMVAKGSDKQAGTIELSGNTRKPGIYALEDTPKLSSLIPDETALGEDIYGLIGIIERWNSKALAHELLEFPLKLVLSGDYDLDLKDGDNIHLFSFSQIRDL